MTEKTVSLLHQLARLYGIQTAYRDAAGRRRSAPPVSLLAALRALGAEVESLADVPNARREARQLHWRRVIEPVTVAWDGNPAPPVLRLPATAARADCRLELEDRGEKCWSCDLTGLSVLQAETVEGVNYTARQLPLPPNLPWGYHRLTLTLPAGTWEALVIAAPRQAYVSPTAAAGRPWGVFLPLYALHSGQSWGSGDFTDLKALLDWIRGLGGSFTGTLPLLAAFLDEPCDPSPYAPASRLFWNEFYLDVHRAPELPYCPRARELLESPEFRQEIASLRSAPLVDYRHGLAAKRRVLENLARCCFAAAPPRREALERWASARPAAEDYARFRATTEYQGIPWPDWPARMREGKLEKGDYDQQVAAYHLYVQWLADMQLRPFLDAKKDGAGLYLDFPLGVHPTGYDVWRERKVFALDASCGAPPDLFFAAGQDWGTPPLHPERLREQGYQYYIACLRHHLPYAAVLRLDHVMALHRLFWIPRGLPPAQGVYVRYRPEEFYAIIALESHRHFTAIVGEDLGTVPHYVRSSLARHRVHRMYVFQLELPPDPCYDPRPVPATALASLNTHDTPPFAAFWNRRNPDEQAALALFLHQHGRPNVIASDTGAVMKATLDYLAASQARFLLVNLEDLWLETAAQNVPGTGKEMPNWRHRARYSLEEFTCHPSIREVLEKVNRLRKRDQEICKQRRENKTSEPAD